MSSEKATTCVITGLVLCLLFANASAGEEDLLDGFDDFEIAASVDKTTDKPWDISGHIGMSASYTYASNAETGTPLAEYDGLSMLRAQVRLKGNYHFDNWKFHVEAKTYADLMYNIKGRDNFSSEVIDDYAQEFQWLEVYVQGNLSDNLTLTTGRQIVVWGRSDNLRVVDVLNPLDQREPGNTDIEDIRLPVTMTRLDYTHNNWTLTGIAIHEVRFNRTPVAGSEFFPFSALPVTEVEPDNGLAPEFGISLTVINPGWDISFNYAQTFGEAWLDARDVSNLMLRHSKETMAGLAFNRTMGNWLFKGELARTDNLRFSATPDSSYDAQSLLAGVEYGGFSEAQIALEVSRRSISNYDSALVASTPKTQWQNAIRYNQSLQHDKVNLTLVGLFLGKHWNEGQLLRASIEYKPEDSLSLTAGLVLYMDGERPPLSFWEDRDRLLFGFKYFFQR
jgi:hypothetical protein